MSSYYRLAALALLAATACTGSGSAHPASQHPTSTTTASGTLAITIDIGGRNPIICRGTSDFNGTANWTLFPRNARFIHIDVDPNEIGRNYEAAAVEGRIVQIAFMGSPKAEVNFMRVMLKRLHHTGSTLRSRSVADKGAIARAVDSSQLDGKRGVLIGTRSVWPSTWSGSSTVRRSSASPFDLPCSSRWPADSGATGS